MEYRTPSHLASLLKIAPVALMVTGAAVVWTLVVGIIPSLPAFLFDCLLGVVIFFLGYQQTKRAGDPWLASLLSVLNMVIFIGGVLIARESLYHSSDMIVGVQIITMAWFVFFGLLLGFRESFKPESTGKN